MRMRIGLLLAAFLLLSVFQLKAQATDTLIAFVGKRDGNEDIFLTTQTNSITYNLTNARSRDWHPTWASDGMRIAFSTDRDGNNEIYWMEANGQNPVNLTNNPASDTSPDWSPAADEIAFISDRNGGYDLFVQDIKTGDVRQITIDQQAKSDPDWSPDGKQIVYWELADKLALLKTVEVSTGKVTTLIDNGQNQWPAWSPDGSQIAFFSPLDNEKAAIRLYDVKTGDITDLISYDFNNARPDWSPDGSQIAFMSDRDGNYNLYVTSSDGEEISRLTSNPEDDTSAAWQPKPAIIDFSNTALGQSVNIVQGTPDPALQQSLGTGDVQLFAPEEASLEDVIQIRLQLNPAAATGAPPQTPDLPLRDQQAVEVYRFMGARLKGINVEDKFDVYPNPFSYVIQVQEEGENYWEWFLQPKGEAALGNNAFFIELYLPEFQDDGTVIESRVGTFPVQVKVTEEKPTDRTNLRETVLEDKPEVGFGVEYSDNQALSIIFYNTLDVHDMTIVTPRKPVSVAQDFDGIQLNDNRVEAGQCIFYDTQDATPVLSSECQTETPVALEHLLSTSEIFWFRKTKGGIQDVTIQYAGETYICPADAAPERCDF